MEDPGTRTATGPRGGAPVRVLAVDDQAVFRKALRQLIGAAPGFEQVGEASSGEEALASAARLHPDLVLLDVRMPGMDGVETARRLLATDDGLAVVLISLEPLAEADPAPEGHTVTFLRKQQLSVRSLERAWAAHRPGLGMAQGP